ncbi:putative N-acetyltransferase p20-like [Senna tora]|uniref:Putative N-acetyltransferase p20-like n=1 Tax=Senna tora TaxID=362788 RepID=A0A834TL96_9FABA|nr:putative N-acetyltransferase p20-like [Senna tora]
MVMGSTMESGEEVKRPTGASNQDDETMGLWEGERMRRRKELDGAEAMRHQSVRSELAIARRLLQRRRSSLAVDVSSNAVDVSSMASLYLHKRLLHRCRSVSHFSGDDKCRAELRYAIAAMYWGHGVTTEAVEMTVNIVLP